MSLAREDYVALATLPLAAACFAIATAWRGSIQRAIERPIAKKAAELAELERATEALNRTATFAAHAKSQRECTKLRDDIAELRVARQPGLLVRAALFVVYMVMQMAGVVVMRYLCRFYGHVIDPARGIVEPLEEIVMVPHLFTSSAMQAAPAGSSTVDSRTALPLIGGVRSLGYVAWYVCCLLAVRVVFGAVVAPAMSKRPAVGEGEADPAAPLAAAARARSTKDE